MSEFLSGLAGVTIRSCQGFDELDACVQLQIATWGYGDMDVVPSRVFLLAQRIGGQVIGAFDEAAGRELIGFVMALPAIDENGEAYLHSHMLAVLLQHRNRALGRALKLAQRSEALERGIARMEWTFDPLEVKNAYLNIHRLGAVVRRYSANFYGVSSSRLQAGLPTDRLHADWRLRSRRVLAALAQGAGTSPEDQLPVTDRVVVPAAAAEWKQRAEDREQAQNLERLQTEIREHLLRAFDGGQAISGFRRTPFGDGIYELSPSHLLEQQLRD